MRTKKTVAVSGGFDPLHVGHVKLIAAAKRLGDYLVVILNNDHWLKKKKGYVFMRQKERAAILRALRDVDRVIITNHSKNPRDISVCPALAKLRPEVFANGGDRQADNIPEYELCRKLGIKMVFNVGGKKAQSSSWLVKKAGELSSK